jgi:ribosomal protein S12 methylthiotransferase accessory factor
VPNSVDRTEVDVTGPLAAGALPGVLDDASGKGFRRGTDRAVPPARTLALVAPALRAAGITRVANVTGLDRLGVPVWCAVRPLSRNLAVSQGKGISDDAARASAVMESLELWHAERHRLPVRFESAERLAAGAEAVLDPAVLVRCPCSEHRPDRPLRWVRGHDLLHDRTVWVPYESVHCDWRLPTAPGDHAVQNGSNGLASGNTHAEAVVHALCELVERDAVVAAQDAEGWLDPARRVRPETVEDGPCRELVDRFAAAGVAVALWDLTSRYGVPVFNCLAVEVDPPWYHQLPQTQGSGCHPRREVALLRALTEAAQSRATVIAGSRDDIGHDRQRWYFDPEHRRETAEVLAAPAVRDVRDVPDVDHATSAEDLRWLLDRLDGEGVPAVAVVDLTDPALGIPVVRAVVPGLRWRPWEE